MEDNNATNSKILYGVNDTPPRSVLIFSAIQHMLICVSIGLSLPVAVSRTAGLDVAHAGAYLAASLFGMGIVSLFQSFNGKHIGTGYLSMSACDSVAIGCCTMAAIEGGIPLVLGLSLCAAIIKFLFGFFTYQIRKLFPTEATGTLILLLGFTLIPTAFKYFLGTAAGFDTSAFTVACLTLLVMILCTYFIKKLKPYTTLVGIAFGYIISIVLGVFDLSSFSSLKTCSFIAVPVYTEISFAFDAKLLAPFIIVTLASVVDNIGDFSATQAAANPDMKRADWKSIQRGIKSIGIGNTISVLLGGCLQATSTTNIGISGATGIVSRKIAYLAAGLLMFVSFFPKLTGLLSMIPIPVLGAVIVYNVCYILSGGFRTLQKVELDDKKIISIFLSLSVGISALIPNLYSFLPEDVQTIVVSPIVLGVVVLIITTILSKIGTKKHYSFTTGVSEADVIELNDQITDVCKKWGTDRLLSSKLHIAINALCESLYEIDPASTLEFAIAYDQMQIKIKMVAKSTSKELQPDNGKDDGEVLQLTIKILEKMFDNVSVENKKGLLTIKMDEDL